jgi:hypothetical protein
MDIKIITENTNTIKQLDMSNIEPIVAIEHNILEETDFDYIVDKLFESILNYLTTNTEFEHMKDNIINQRMRIIIREKYNKNIENIISKFIKFLETDEIILEYIQENNKLIYGSGDDIDNYIYDEIYEEIYGNSILFDIAQGWLSWDNYRCKFSNNNNFVMQAENITIDNTIEYVFEKLGSKFEYIKKNTDENNKSNENEDSDNEDTDDDNDNKNNNCIIV